MVGDQVVPLRAAVLAAAAFCWCSVGWCLGAATCAGDEGSKPASAPAEEMSHEKLLARLLDGLRSRSIATKEQLLDEMERIGPESAATVARFARNEEPPAKAQASAPSHPAVSSPAVSSPAVLSPASPAAESTSSRPAPIAPQARETALWMLERIPTTALESIQPKDVTPEERLATQAIGIAVLGEIGATPDDVRLAIDLSKAKNPDEGIDCQVSPVFEGAIERMLRRRPSLYSDVGLVIAKTTPTIQASLIAAIGATCCRDASQCLARLLGRWPAIDRLLIQQIGRRSGKAPIVLSPTDVAALRHFLESRETTLRREAALAVGRFEDPESVGALIDLLGDPDRGVQENAHWALRQITGLGFHLDPKRWRGWHDQERAWWTTAAPGLIEMLDSENPVPTAGAIRELSLRRLFRNEVTERLVPLLAARNRKVSKIAFAAVENLESERAIPALIDLLGDSDGSVQADALHALCRITGESHPAARADWETFLR